MKIELPKNEIRIGTLAGKGRHTAEYIRQILPHGFESFQLNFWQNTDGITLPQLAQDLEPILDGSGAIISSVSVFGNPLEHDEKAEGTRQLWVDAIDHAHLFGSNLVTGFAGRLRDLPVPDSINRFKEVFGPLVQRAADKGVRIAFENCPMDGTWTHGDWNIAFCPAAWELMFDAIPADNLGLEWEPCHQMGQLIDPLPQLRQWMDKVFHVHGKDATLYHDVIRTHGISAGKEHYHHRHPGFGDTNWTDLISILRMHGYQGTIDIEGWHDPVYKDDLEMTGQVHSLNYLKQCRTKFVPNPVLPE